MSLRHVLDTRPPLSVTLAREDVAREATMRLMADLGEPGASARVARAASGSPNLDISTLLARSSPGYSTTIVDFGDGVVEARAVFVEADNRLRAPRSGDKVPRVLTVEEVEQKREWVRQRARKSLRFRCLCLQADHMITLTKRGKFETADEAYQAFRAWLKIISKFPQMGMQYVAVPEQHADERWHLHVAVRGRYDVSRLRVFWYRALGGVGNEKGEDTPGSINIRYFHQRKKAAFSVAAYMSKYMGKSIEAIGPGKRAYWCSKGLRPVSVRKLREPYGQCIVLRLFEHLRALAPKSRFGVYEWRYVGLSGLIVRSM